MKKVIKQEVEQEVYICDVEGCGKEMPYGFDRCIVCGKVFCATHLQDHLISLEIPRPKAWPYHGTMLADFKNVYACPGCKDGVTMALIRLRRMVVNFNKKAEDFFFRARQDSRDIQAEIERRENRTP